MHKTLIRWGLFFVSLLVAGPLAWVATGNLRASDGGPDTTPLLSTTPLLGICLAIGAVVLAGILGVLTARLVNIHSALFNTGMVLAWAAFGAGQINAIARSSGDPRMAWRLAIEGAMLALPAIFIAWAIARLAPPHHHLAVPDRHDNDRPAFIRVGLPVFVGILSGFIASWLVAQNFLTGQTIAAAAVAGILSAAVALVLDHRAHPAAIIAGVLLMACVGPLAGAITHGQMFQPNAAAAAKLARFAGVLPLDWLSGAFLGAPMGLSLGSWIAEGRNSSQKARPATA